MPQRQDPPRRELLLDEIEAVVLAEGFRGLRVGDLASRLRCSRSTLYKLSPSKAELMRLVFARFINRAIDDAQAAAEREHTLEDKIMRFLLTLQRWQAKGSLSFWGDARDLDLVAGVLDEQSARGYRILQRYMDEGIADGSFRPSNTAFLSYIGWLAARAARDPDVLGRAGLSPGDAMGEIARFVVYGMMPMPPVAQAKR